MMRSVPAGAARERVPKPYELLDVGDVQIAYRVTGDGDTVGLVHSGTGSGDFDWRHQVPVLAERYRVVVLDLRGHAHSSDGPITLDTLTADVDAVCRHVDAYPVHFLAASHGTFPVLRIAMDMPEKVRSVAVVGSVWRDDHLTPDQDEGLLARWPRSLRGLHERHGRDHWADLLRRLIHDRRVNVRFAEDDFRRLRCPLLVAQGDRDEFLNVTISNQAATWAGGELFVLPAAGHPAHVEAPELFNLAYLAFLARVEVSQARSMFDPGGQGRVSTDVDGRHGTTSTLNAARDEAT